MHEDPFYQSRLSYIVENARTPLLPKTISNEGNGRRPLLPERGIINEGNARKPLLPEQVLINGGKCSNTPFTKKHYN